MKKPVLVISSHVVRGSIGNRAAVFALETLGHSVWALPTIILPYHPGHGMATRVTAEPGQYQNLLEDLLKSPWIGELGAVLTGYMPTRDHVLQTADFISALKIRFPGIAHVCDPVMGDNGRLYVDEGTATAMRQKLSLSADILTPNRFELGFLADSEIHSTQAAIDAARALSAAKVLVTSMPGMMRGSIGNLLVDANSAWFAEHRELEKVPNGPGDLTAALFLSHISTMGEPAAALEMTSASVYEIVSGAARRHADELMLEADAASIRQPRTRVQVRAISDPTIALKKRNAT